MLLCGLGEFNPAFSYNALYTMLYSEGLLYPRDDCDELRAELLIKIVYM